jgi:serine/threonine protein kinase/tetratricopeptide (TPR) repeat protein
MSTVRELFDELIDLPAEARQARLRSADLPAAERERLHAMLQDAGRRRTLLDVPLAAAIERLRDDDTQLLHRMVGTRIGAFRLLELVGEGGSSVVFRAERPAGLGAQVVALKLLQHGLCSPEAQRRFMREQAILARLTHPDIARLIEAGVSEAGIPYIAMEYVDGAPLDAAANHARLDLRARLQMFVRLCRAVAAAHAALVVHCDLKPANVIVDAQGGLKVLDFGIANLVGAVETEAGREQAMTPEYAAPEQRRGEPPTVAVDVYALGMMLGELLTGHRCASGSETLSRTLLRDADGETGAGLPPRPLLARRLAGDLDAIHARATVADPAARYRSAEALARDIERHLDGFPVQARPASRWRSVGRFVERHRVAVGCGVLLGLAVVASTVIALQQARVARQEAETARRALARAETWRGYLFDAFAEAIPGKPGSGPATVIDAVERALSGLADRQDGDVRVALELQAHLAEVLSAQGAHARAETVLDDARRRALADLEPGDLLVLEIEHIAAENIAKDGRWEDGRRALDDLIARIPAEATALRVDALTTSAWLAGVAREPGRGPDEARSALALARQLGDSYRTQQALRALGTLLIAKRQADEAIAVYQDLLAQQRARYGEVHSRVAAEETALSRAYRLAGDLDEAERHARRAIEIDREVYPGDHWHKALHLNALAMVQSEKRAFDETLQTLDEILRINRATLPATHPNQIGTYKSQAAMRGHLGRWDEAVEWSQRAMQGHRANDSEAGWDGLRAAALHGYVLAMSGDRRAGEAAIDRALSLARDDSDPNAVAELLVARARIGLDAGDLDAAAGPIDALQRLKLEPLWRHRASLLRAEAGVARGQNRDALDILRALRAQLAAESGPDAAESTHVALLIATVVQREPALAQPGEDAPALAAEAMHALRYPPPHLTRLARALGLAPD